jgi:hypothetical protein
LFCAELPVHVLRRLDAQACEPALAKALPCTSVVPLGMIALGACEYFQLEEPIGMLGAVLLLLLPIPVLVVV